MVNDGRSAASMLRGSLVPAGPPASAQHNTPVAAPSSGSLSPFPPIPGSAPLVLLVEAEPHIVTLVHEALPAPRYRVLHAATGAAARAAVTGFPPDPILLDLSLPDQEGLVLLDALRRHTAAPIIV